MVRVLSRYHDYYMPIIRLVHTVYKVAFSPLLGERCRFYPFCSDYAVGAIERHGLVRGCILALGRLIRCNPLCRGGSDPIP